MAEDKREDLSSKNGNWGGGGMLGATMRDIKVST
jgi:hypothetical protein